MNWLKKILSLLCPKFLTDPIPDPIPDPEPLTPRKTVKEIQRLVEIVPAGIDQAPARGALEDIWAVAVAFLDPTDNPPPEVPDPEMIVWSVFRAEDFGIQSTMKLHGVRNFWAFDMVSVALLWDGIRNPNKALQYEWKTYRGRDRTWVQATIQRCVAARAALADLATQKKVEPWYPFGQEEGSAGHKFYKGKLVNGTISRDDYLPVIKGIMKVADMAGEMDRIAAISQGDTDGFTF